MAAVAKWFQQVDIKYIQATYGSSCWVVSAEQLQQNVQAFQKFTGNNKNILFPVKANPSVAVLEILARLGCGADCANEQEVINALFCGFKFENIVYNSPVQEVSFLVYLLKNGSTVVLDDINVITQLEEKLKTENYTGNIWLRVNPLQQSTYAILADNQELMHHGNASSKFGIPEEEIFDLLSVTSLKFSGLHVHVGTQMDNLEAFDNAINSLNIIGNKLIGLGHPVAAIDIGGGLGISFTESDVFPEIEDWTRRLLQHKQAHYEYFVEPGHALVGNAVGLLTTVKTIKKSRGRRWAVCDIGTDQLAKVTLLKWQHIILNAENKALPLNGNDAVAGPLCFAGDTLLHNTDVSCINIGDPLLVTNAGAYTFSLSNSFNGRLSPAWVIAENNKYYLKTRAEDSYSKLLLNHNYWFDNEEVNHNNAVPEVLGVEQIKLLQSEYLSETSKHDTYKLLKFEMVKPHIYNVTAITQSQVSFISMPFATRIFGDAVIVALLHLLNKNEKDISVWGRKLHLDCFKTLPSNTIFNFRLCLSKVTANYKHKAKAVVSFETSCKAVAGEIVVYL